MHKNATKCNKTQSKWCINMHGASKIIDTFEKYDILFNSPLLWNTFGFHRNTFGLHRNYFGLRWNYFGHYQNDSLSHISSHVVSEYYQNYLKHRDPLIVLPDGSRTLQTLPRTLSGKSSSIRSGYLWWSLCILWSSFSRWAVSIDVPFPLYYWY
jgi:hypothetical protein